SSITFDDDEFFFQMTRPFQENTKGIADERCPPEFQSAIRGRLKTDAVDASHVYAVCNGMTALDRFPGVVLSLAEFRLLAGVPADGRGIDEHLSTFEGRQPCPFGKPLVPANEGAHFA